jgi:hypothetical protein
MKLSKIFLLLFFFLLFSKFLQSQQWWVEQVSNTNVKLTSAFTGYYVGDGWVCGFNGTVLKTVNRGAVWINVSGNGIPNDVSLVSIVAGWFNGYVVLTLGNRGDTSFVYRSTNNGLIWTQVFRQNSGRMNAISKIDYNGKVFMQGNPVGGRWSLWKSTNAGANWDSAGIKLMQNGIEISANNSIASINNSFLFGTNNGRLYYTTNNGSTFRILFTPLEPSPLAIDVGGYMPDTTFSGYVGGTSRVLLTTNGGYSWDTVNTLPGGTGLIGAITLRGLPVEQQYEFAQTIFVRNDNKIYKKWPGSAWYIEYTAPTGNYTYTSKSSYDVWAVRDNGGISFCSCPLSGIEKEPEVIADNFTLYQNYPNPFNPTTNIKFDIIKEAYSKLVIYDVLGNEIKILVIGKLNRGKYSFDFYGTNLSSGLYFCKLTIFKSESSAIDYVETKKMLLIK